jgi:uncharacterized alkaline shock family protein YloU
MYDKLKQMDKKELDLPETVFIRDIEGKVFQAIVLKCLAKIEGVGILENNLFDNLLGREAERVKGVHVEQDQKKHSVNIRVEINVAYGVSIPDKAEEVQTNVAREISAWTGLHVSSVHVVFKNLISPQPETGEEEKSYGSVHDKVPVSAGVEEYGEAF